MTRQPQSSVVHDSLWSSLARISPWHAFFPSRTLVLFEQLIMASEPRKVCTLCGPLFFFRSRLRVVPLLSSGIVERAKRERAWKSLHARKGDTRRGERKFFLSPHRVAFRSLYYPWGKVGDYYNLDPLESAFRSVIVVSRAEQKRGFRFIVPKT